ncbi:MAG: hypothetical protein QXL78_01650 [Methanocellales archaeon]
MERELPDITAAIEIIVLLIGGMILFSVIGLLLKFYEGMSIQRRIEQFHRYRDYIIDRVTGALIIVGRPVKRKKK